MIAPIDVDDEYGATATLAPVAVAAPVLRRGQVIAEAGRRSAMVSRIHDAADVERKSALKRFFRLASAEGLDTADAHRMRQALGYFLGRCVYSRADLSAGELAECEAGLWVGLLAW